MFFNYLIRQDQSKTIINDTNEWKQQVYDNVVMICGGSGITPMFQIIENAYFMKDMSTNFYLVYATKKQVLDKLNKEDLLFRDYFEKLKKGLNLNCLYFVENFNVMYMLIKGRGKSIF